MKETNSVLNLGGLYVWAQLHPTLDGPMTPLPVEFFRQECWSGVLFPTPGDLPHP